MDREHLLPFREIEIFKRRYNLDARIAHEHVDAAEGRDRLGHAGVDLCLARYVHRDADRIVAAELCRRRVGAGLIQIGDHDLGAFALKGARDLLADAARGAGDERNFA
jgi:hypothetical protein